MKSKNIILRGSITGAISAILLDVLAQFLVSPYCGTVRGDNFLTAALFAIIAALVTAYFLKYESSKKRFLIFFCWDILSFLVMLFLCFLNHLTLRLSWFPVGTVNSGNGILILFSSIIFVGLTLILKFAAMTILIYKNRRRQ